MEKVITVRDLLGLIRGEEKVEIICVNLPGVNCVGPERCCDVGGFLDPAELDSVVTSIWRSVYNKIVIESEVK